MRTLIFFYLLALGMSCSSGSTQALETADERTAEQDSPYDIARLDSVVERAIELCKKHMHENMQKNYLPVFESYVVNIVDSTGDMPYTNGVAPLMLAVVPDELMSKSGIPKTETVMEFRESYFQETGAAMIGVNRRHLRLLSIDVLACALIHEATHVAQAYLVKTGKKQPYSEYASEHEAYDVQTAVFFREHPEFDDNIVSCNCQDFSMVANRPEEIDYMVVNMAMFRFCPTQFIYDNYGVRE